MKLNLFKSLIFKNLFFLYSSYLARYVFPLIVIPFLSRKLGADTWGEVLFTQSFALYVALIVEFGFGISATREVSSLRDNTKELSSTVNTTIFSQLAISLLLVIICSPLIFVVPIFQQNNLLFILGLGSGVFQGLNFFWFFRGLERMKNVAFVEFVTKLVSTATIFILINDTMDGWKVLFATLLSNILSCMYGFFYIKKEIIFSIPVRYNILRVLKSGLPFFWVRAGAGLSSLGLIFVCGLFLTPSLLAFFIGAEKIITTIRSLLTPAVDALFPRLSYLVTNSPREGIALIRKSFVWLSLIGLSLSVGVYVFAELLVQVILGPGFEESIKLLRILSPLPLIVSINHCYGSQWMLPIGLDKYFSYSAVLLGILNVIIATTILYLDFHYSSIAYIIIISNIALFIFYFFLLKFRRLSFFDNDIVARLS